MMLVNSFRRSAARRAHFLHSSLEIKIFGVKINISHFNAHPILPPGHSSLQPGFLFIVFHSFPVAVELKTYAPFYRPLTFCRRVLNPAHFSPPLTLQFSQTNGNCTESCSSAHPESLQYTKSRTRRADIHVHCCETLRPVPMHKCRYKVSFERKEKCV